MDTFKQNPVSQVVWKWQAAAEEPVAHGQPRAVRAIIQAIVMCVIASLLLFWLHHRVMATIVYCLAAIVLTSGLFIPPVFNAIERFGQWLGKKVSHGLTWILLVPFFYICFAPARLILKLMNKDPMCRECPSKETTYWVHRPPVENADHYRKQH